MICQLYISKVLPHHHHLLTAHHAEWEGRPGGTRDTDCLALGFAGPALPARVPTALHPGPLPRPPGPASLLGLRRAGRPPRFVEAPPLGQGAILEASFLPFLGSEVTVVQPAAGRELSGTFWRRGKLWPHGTHSWEGTADRTLQEHTPKVALDGNHTSFAWKSFSCFFV